MSDTYWIAIWSRDYKERPCRIAHIETISISRRWAWIKFIAEMERGITEDQLRIDQELMDRYRKRLYRKGGRVVRVRLEPVEDG